MFCNVCTDGPQRDGQGRMLAGCMTLLAIKTKGWAPSAERISPKFNLTLLLFQALAVAYRASHCLKIARAVPPNVK